MRRERKGWIQREKRGYKALARVCSSGLFWDRMGREGGESVNEGHDIPPFAKGE